jgi:multiple sugar transport system ATP-binding protein
VAIAGLPARGPVTLGFRAEDARLAPPEAAEVSAPVYAMELLGEATMATVRVGPALVAVKADKDWRAEIGQPVGFAVRPEICHLFDRETGARLAA